MPHICTRCNNIFESGEDILKGCPVCGWKKFMFVRKKPEKDGNASSAEAEQIITRAMGVRVPPKKVQREEYEVQRVERAPLSVRAPVPTYPQDRQDPAPQSAADRPDANALQADILQSVAVAQCDPYDASHAVKRIETQPAPEVEPVDENKLESIKITGPGTYELNLPSLFERDELIMAVKEGTYFIDLSSAFRKGKKD